MNDKFIKIGIPLDFFAPEINCYMEQEILVEKSKVKFNEENLPIVEDWIIELAIKTKRKELQALKKVLEVLKNEHA